MTSTILLPVPPQGNDPTNPAGLRYEFGIPRITLSDSGSVKEGFYWNIKLPEDYSSGLAIRLDYSMISATSGTMELEISVWKVSDADTTGTESYATANVFTETVPGTAKDKSEILKTLSNDDGAVAGDTLRIRVLRDSPTDTATGDLEIDAANIEYTAA